MDDVVFEMELVESISVKQPSREIGCFSFSKKFIETDLEIQNYRILLFGYVADTLQSARRVFIIQFRVYEA